MPITIPCPNCQKKLQARDELAGKRVKCPSCGQIIVVPGMTSPSSPAKSLAQAVERGDAAEIAALIRKQDFTLIESPEASGEEGTAALMAESDDFPVLVAFTSKDYASKFAGTMPDLLDDDGTLPAFEVTGANLLKYLPEGCGLLLNPESDDSTVLPPDLVDEVKSVRPKASTPKAQGPATPAEILRQQVLAYLEARGFRPARWLPGPEMTQKVRPAAEIASRLMALAALFTWTSAPESAVSSERVLQHIKRNRLREWLTDEEAQIIALPRAEAQEAHADAIGWKLENKWALAWVLGFESEPTIEASQIDQAVSRAILFKFLPGLEGSVEGLLQKSRLRSSEEVIALEDRFYCAHNAVRSAQLGEATVPEGFHPVMHGGAIHERRHALTWCLHPGTAWDDTDLST